MLLIALSGGSVAEREAVADALVSSGKGGFAAFAQHTPNANSGARRAEVLRGVLDGSDQSRIPGLVVVHCLAEEEAMVVRRYGGVIWHVYGAPSKLVHIRQGDPIVTAKPEGFRHVRTSLEALSERLQALPLKARKALSLA